ILAAWIRYRSRWRRLGGTGEWSPGELRSAEMQGSAQRTDGDGPALSRRMEFLGRATAADEGRHDSGERRGELLHVGGSVRHVRPGSKHSDQHGEWLGR